MLRVALICPDEQMRLELTAALSRLSDCEIVRSMDAYPSPDGILRTIRVHKVDMLLLGADDLAQASTLVQSIDELIHGFPIVTVSSQEAVETLHKLMQLGVCEHLTCPVRREKLEEAFGIVRRRLAAHPVSLPRQADLCTFFPAKPGVGTSTIAVSTSCALSERFNAKTLLLDCDLMAGTVKFLLNLGSSASIVDALMHSENLDEDLWSQMVGKWDGLEILHAGELNSPICPNPSDLQHVLSLARAQYEVICADLGSGFDPFSVALLRESQKIFLVTTPEVVPLHLARVRLNHLAELGLKDRVSLVLNRRLPKGMSDAEVADAVGIPVTYGLGNDYKEVQKSILDASPIPAKHCELGESILNLAHSLALHREPDHKHNHRKFLEFFHIPHAHDADALWRG